MGPYSFIHLNRGRKRAPPKRSETSSSLALAMGMLESSFFDMDRDWVRVVSQSGLTHEVGLLLLVVVLGLLGFGVEGFSMEDLMEKVVVVAGFLIRVWWRWFVWREKGESESVNGMFLKMMMN